MIFRRAILREFANLAAVTFIALVSIYATQYFVRFLGEAATGKLAPEAVLALLGLQILIQLPVLLTLTLFFAVLMTLSRCYHDSEMVVWFTSGVPLTAFIRPVAVFAAPLILVIALLSFFLTPWAWQQGESLRNRLEHQDEISRVAPGVFRESANSDRIVFAEGVDGNSREVQNIFVNSLNKDRVSVTMSKRGYQETHANGERFLVLVNGRRYDGVPGTPEYKIWDFERYYLRIDAPETPDLQASTSAMSTYALVKAPNDGNRAELLWRIGVPLSAINLVLLAIPLSFVNPRAGRSLNLLLAVLIYYVYSSLIKITQAWVAQGRLHFEIGWWLVHLVMLLVLLAMFYRRLTVLPMFSWLRYQTWLRNQK